MKGCITICKEHLQVYNAAHEIWQAVSQETLDELLAMAEEMGAKVFDGVCKSCNEAVVNSFRSLYANRYWATAYEEMGNDIKVQTLQGLDPSME